MGRLTAFSVFSAILLNEPVARRSRFGMWDGMNVRAGATLDELRLAAGWAGTALLSP